MANIHRVRASFLKLHELLCRKRTADFHRSLDEAGWLHHLASLLRGAVATADAIHSRRRSVLVHCSDGWDRTMQV